MAYRAEIEIVAKGVTKVTQLQKGLNQLAKQIDHLNGPGSLKDFNGQLAQAKKLLDRAQQGTVEEKRAVDKYVTALKNANTAQVRTNKLIAEEIRQRDGATASLKRYNAAAASARQPGGSMAGRYVRPGSAASRTQFSSPIGPKPGVQFGSTTQFGPTPLAAPESIFRGQSSAVEGRVKRILEIKKGELQLEKALIGLQQKSRGLDAASIADNNRILDIKAKEVSRNNEIIRQEKVRQSILRKRQRLEAAGRGPGGGRGRRGSRFQDIATGAGFPLLFGGGPIQALAGGIGGAFGGLGGSIAASAITAQVEAFATEAAKVGQALNSTGGALELMREKSLFSTDAARERAAVLEELGQVEELAAHLGQEMAKAIGNEGVKALQDLGETSKETTRLWNLLTTQLFRLVSGPLNAFLKIVNQALGGITVQQQVEARKADLGADGAAALDARIAELVAGDDSGITEKRKRRGFKGVGGLSKTEARTQALGEAQFQVAAKPLPITAQDQRDFSVSGGGTKKDVVPGLKIQVQLQERLLGLNTKIAEAKRDGDEGAAAVLEVEKIFEQTAANINKIKAEGLDKEAETLKIRSEELNGLQQVEAVNNRMRDAEAKKAEKVKETVSNLQDEGALLQAKLDGSETEVALKQKIAEATKDLSAEDAKRVENLIRANALLSEQVKIADQTNQVYAQIGQTIQSGIVGGIQSAIDGSKSLGESLSGILKQLGGIFLQAGIGSLGIGGQTGSGLLGLLPFAEGGYVSGPTPALVGEGGEPEYVIPESKMRESMSRYSRGSRGSSVIPEAGASGTSGDGGIAVAAPIDVRYTVERINSVDYVTADQFQNGLQSAAAQGAQRGEQNTLKRLQMSGSARKRIGL